MILVSATSGVRRTMLLLKVIFFSGEEYNKLKVFLEEMSDQTIDITPYNVAFYYVEYCKQNEIKVNESKIDNYIEKIQQSLIPNKGKEVFKKIIYDHAINYSKKGTIMLREN